MSLTIKSKLSEGPYGPRLHAVILDMVLHSQKQKKYSSRIPYLIPVMGFTVEIA